MQAVSTECNSIIASYLFAQVSACVITQGNNK